MRGSSQASCLRGVYGSVAAYRCRVVMYAVREEGDAEDRCRDSNEPNVYRRDGR